MGLTEGSHSTLIYVYLEASLVLCHSRIRLTSLWSGDLQLRDAWRDDKVARKWLIRSPQTQWT